MFCANNFIYVCNMVKVTVELSDEAHIRLLELQLERKRSKKEPSAINKIASEILEKSLKEKAEK